MLRNMRSCGIDLAPWVEKGLLRFHADRPSRFGLETHLLMMHRTVEQSRPTVAVVDPITNLMSVGTRLDVRGMLTRTIDYLKLQNVKALFTSLTGTHEPDVSDPLISSLMDTWILTSLEEAERRRRRWIYVLKARGIAHSDEMREFRIGSTGIDILSGASTTEAARW
jgi:circadian clock protein KaiC